MNYGLIWWVIGLPLAGFLVQCMLGKSIIDNFGNKVGKWICGLLAVAPIAVAFGMGVQLTSQLLAIPEAGRRSFVLTMFPWITLKSLSVPCEVLIDPLSMTMVLIITGIGALIHLYATGYMSEEKDYSRFFCYLNLFIAFMLVLVLGNNLVMLFVGWEGVGLCSYLLIGFWYKDLANAKAANKAFIVNRIGDWGLTLGMFLLVCVLAGSTLRTGTDPRWLSYDVSLPNAIDVLKNNPGIATAIALLLFVGACGKSAQFPLYFWLPDAMAGPTPVSALIHAATMVTSGVFLLNRLHVLFELSPAASAIIAATGAFTALFAALIAFGQTDIKKVLAYSTVSQLGFMFIACGAGGYWAGMFHVTTHAFFKALLFLGSGAVIHAMMHNQDMRNYGNLRKYLPITFITMMIGYVAISGLPLFAGFYSKEAILGQALAGDFATIEGVKLAYWSGWVGLVVAALTAMYMTRMTWLTFWGREERWRLIPAAEGHGHHDHAHHAEHAHHAHDHGPDTNDFFFTDEEMHQREMAEGHEHHHELDAEHKPREVPVSMWVPLVALAFLSTVGGYWLNSGERFLNWLYPTRGQGGQRLSLLQPGVVEAHPHGIPLVELSIGAAVLGIIVGLAIYWKGLPGKEGWDLSKWSPFRRKAADQFGYDDLVVEAGVKGGGMLANFSWKGIDVIVIDGIVNLVGGLTKGLGGALRYLQTGYVRGYALLMLAGGIGILGWFLYAMTRTSGGQ